MSVPQDIVADEEVCISYGCQNKNNEELMRDYGMVLPANPNDRIPFSSGAWEGQDFRRSTHPLLLLMLLLGTRSEQSTAN